MIRTSTLLKQVQEGILSISLLSLISSLHTGNLLWYTVRPVVLETVHTDLGRCWLNSKAHFLLIILQRVHAANILLYFIPVVIYWFEIWRELLYVMACSGTGVHPGGSIYLRKGLTVAVKGCTWSAANLIIRGLIWSQKTRLNTTCLTPGRFMLFTLSISECLQGNCLSKEGC